MHCKPAQEYDQGEAEQGSETPGPGSSFTGEEGLSSSKQFFGRHRA